MLFEERLIPTEDCEGCELQDICNVGHVSMPSCSVITCEAFKNAVREYGGKEKILEEIYNLIKEATLYKEEEQDVNEPITYDRFLQSYSFGTVSEGPYTNGFLLHAPYVSPERRRQGDTFRITSIH